MTAPMTNNAGKAIGCFRLAMVLLATAIIVVLGFGIAHATAPAAGDTCSVRNATTHDRNGKPMSCTPTVQAGHSVWQYPPAA
jgi:hypothetical protein